MRSWSSVSVIHSGALAQISRTEFRPTVITSDEFLSVMKLLAMVIMTDSNIYSNQFGMTTGSTLLG